MSKFPYMNMPFSYYRSYPRFPNSYNYSSYFNPTNNSIASQTLNGSTHHNAFESSQKFDSTSKIEKQKNKSNSNDSNYLFDLFGLKLYFDDILILSLLFFLYTEGVKDEMLFISLLLLLIS